MERHEVLQLMTELKLGGMRAAFDEVIADGLKRQHPVQRIVGDLLRAEIAEKQARSIKYQMTTAKLPLAKDVAEHEPVKLAAMEALYESGDSVPISKPASMRSCSALAMNGA